MRQRDIICEICPIVLATTVIIATVLGGCRHIQGIDTAINVQPDPSPPGRATPDILIVGDSQISYGAGQAHLAFFENLLTQCRDSGSKKQTLGRLGTPLVSAIGVRSSSLHSWTLADENGKAVVCRADKKHGVNAGVYGFSGKKSRRYVQIGRGKDFQFCKAGATPFQAMFHRGYYNPKLVVFAFLGNSVERWISRPASAIADARRTMQQIPTGTRCIFMTTAPSYDQASNQRRRLAQTIIRKAFREIGSRCSFVMGINPQTRTAFSGNKSFFRTNQSGIVTDPNHPNERAANKFFDIMRPQLCKAVITQLL